MKAIPPPALPGAMGTDHLVLTGGDRPALLLLVVRDLFVRVDHVTHAPRATFRVSLWRRDNGTEPSGYIADLGDLDGATVQARAEAARKALRTAVGELPPVRQEDLSRAWSAVLGIPIVEASEEARREREKRVAYLRDQIKAMDAGMTAVGVFTWDEIAAQRAADATEAANESSATAPVQDPKHVTGTETKSKEASDG
ncbi:MAG: hypothetical protein ACHREM_00245 [Polyangiales bacterium]